MAEKTKLDFYEIPLGDESILQSPNAIKAETQPGALEKPVVRDKRGLIQRFSSLNLDWLKQYNVKAQLPNIIYTKKGFMRGGDIHKCIQYGIVLSGKIELWTLEKGNTIKRVLMPNTFIIINPYVPHLYNFLEDTVLMEWWNSKFEAWFYKPYRELIEEQINKTSQ